MRRESLSLWLAAALLPSESTALRRCSCQALKPSERLRLYEYFEPIFATSAVANGEADLELNDMQVLPMLPEIFVVEAR
ncbi:MAG: hypothetical protein JO042_07010 [Sinobacteraceae bacterium]|nr:hypothetical protein [Nevskiaceae bacterium]